MRCATFEVDSFASEGFDQVELGSLRVKISDEEKAVFGKVGVLAFTACITKTAAQIARNAILEEPKRLGLRDNGKWQTKKLEGISPFQVAT